MAGESAHQIWAEGLAALDAKLRAFETKGRRAIRRAHPHRARNVAAVVTRLLFRPPTGGHFVSPLNLRPLPSSSNRSYEKTHAKAGQCSQHSKAR